MAHRVPKNLPSARYIGRRYSFESRISSAWDDRGKWCLQRRGLWRSLASIADLITNGCFHLQFATRLEAKLDLIANCAGYPAVLSDSGDGRETQTRGAAKRPPEYSVWRQSWISLPDRLQKCLPLHHSPATSAVGQTRDALRGRQGSSPVAILDLESMIDKPRSLGRFAASRCLYLQSARGCGPLLTMSIA